LACPPHLSDFAIFAFAAMGKKDNAKTAEEKASLVSNAAEPPKDKKEEEDEDTPVVKALKDIDEKYCIAEVAMEREIEKLHKAFAARQAPLLEERLKILSDAAEAKDEDKTKGTPACPDFWVKALSNAAQLEEYCFDCDEQVFKYIKDVKGSFVDAECEKKGYRVEFVFAENPFFTNTSLWLEAHYDYDFATARPWKEPDCIELKSCTIDWKAGKNITMEKKQDAPSKKGGSKKKSGKAKEEPCPSFFRALFTPCKKSDEEVPDGIACVYEAIGETPEDEDEMLEMHLEMVGQVAGFIHTEFVPYAVRFYTGEACEDDDDDEESEEESGVEDSDEEESDDEPAPRGRSGKKAPAKGDDKKKGGEAAGEPKAGEKAEECKQQ